MRRKGDYECRAWDQISAADGSKMAAQPVCDLTSSVPCDLLGALNCSVLGAPNDATQMRCRTRDGTLLPDGSASGYCLDLTSSGP